MTSANLTQKKPSNILRSKKAYDLKISQSIIYVKGYFYTFFSTLKSTIHKQSKANHRISQILMIICLKVISEKFFSFNVDVNNQPTAPLSTGRALGGQSCTQRALEHLGTRRVWVIEGTLGGRGGGTRTLKVNALLIFSCNTQKSSLNVCLIKKYFCVFITQVKKTFKSSSF